jgi:hypothetical protein
MSFFHTHRYKLETKTYAEPRATGVTKVNGEGGLRFVEIAAFGMTTVLYRCQDGTCGDLKTIEMLGKETYDDPNAPFGGPMPR